MPEPASGFRMRRWRASKNIASESRGLWEPPLAAGFRSLSVTLRQNLDLYAWLRPVKYIPGVPSPLKDPGKVDIVVFRENVEDLYAGIEWPSQTPEAAKVIEFLNHEMGQKIRTDSAIGIKPMSPFNSKRLIRKAIQWALDHHCPSVTLVHKGNILKFTEGGFRDWGYELAREEFSGKTLRKPIWRQGERPPARW